jgi:hypothetical protein
MVHVSRDHNIVRVHAKAIFYVKYCREYFLKNNIGISYTFFFFTLAETVGT